MADRPSHYQPNDTSAKHRKNTQNKKIIFFIDINEESNIKLIIIYYHILIIQNTSKTPNDNKRPEQFEEFLEQFQSCLEIVLKEISEEK